MTKADLVEQVTASIARTAGPMISKKDCARVVDAFLEAVKEALKQQHNIEVRGFGTFKIRRRKTRMARNPRTGDPVEVAARPVPVFKPSKELRALVADESEPAGHGPWTAGAPPRLPVARMDNPGAVPSWLFGQRPGEAGMQADIDEPATRSEDAAGLGGQDREVVHVAMGELRHHQVQGPTCEWQPSSIGLDQRRPKRSASVPGHSELIGRRIHAHDGPSCASQGGQVCASPAAHIKAVAWTGPDQAQQQRRGGRAVGGDALVVPVGVTVIARWGHQLTSSSTRLSVWHHRAPTGRLPTRLASRGRSCRRQHHDRTRSTTITR